MEDFKDIGFLTLSSAANNTAETPSSADLTANAGLVATVSIAEVGIAVSHDGEFPDLSDAAEGSTGFKTAVYREGLGEGALLPSYSAFVASVLDKMDGEGMMTSIPEGEEAVTASFEVRYEGLPAGEMGGEALSRENPTENSQKGPEGSRPARYQLHEDGLLLAGRSPSAPRAPADLEAFSSMLRGMISTFETTAQTQMEEKITGEERSSNATAAFSHLFGREGHLVPGQSESTHEVVDPSNAAPTDHMPLPATSEAAVQSAASSLQSPFLHGLPAFLIAECKTALQATFALHGGRGQLEAGNSAAPSAAPADGTSTTAQICAAPLLVPQPSAAPAPVSHLSGLASINIAACQVHSLAADVTANLQQMEAILQDLQAATATAGGDPVDLVVFPETYLTGYHIGPTLLRALAMALPAADELTSAVGHVPSESAVVSTLFARSTDDVLEEGINPLLVVACLAKRYDMAIAVSYPELSEQPDSRNPHPSLPCIYNSISVFDTDGSVAGHYRKTHLWGCAYEKQVFTTGPGPMLPVHIHNGAVPRAAVSEAASDPPVWCPYEPFTIRKHPRLKIGLLVCFDVEFPETVRSLAAAGAKLVLTALASGDNAGLSSRKIIPTRAAESHVALVFCNFPSEPLPEELWFPDGSRKLERPVADDAIGVRYSGGTTICGPDGKVLHALPAYPCNPALAPADSTHQPVSSPYYREFESFYATKKLQSRANQQGPARDAAVVLATYNPGAAHYIQDEDRNPYFLDRRPELYRF